MKIVDLETFLSLPVGAVACKYMPCYFDHLFIKDDSLPNDFILQYLTDQIGDTDSENFSDQLFIAQAEGTSVDMNFNTTMRDGCFDDGQLFAVWEKKDIEGLIAKLTDSLNKL